MDKGHDTDGCGRTAGGLLSDNLPARELVQRAVDTPWADASIDSGLALNRIGWQG